jgi:hypothetical protein
LGYVEMPSQEKTTKNNPKCTHNRISHSPDLHPWIFVSALLEGYTEPARKREDHRKKHHLKASLELPGLKKGGNNAVEKFLRV